LLLRQIILSFQLLLFHLDITNAAKFTMKR
jgi:hypothetical protein